MRTAFSIQIHCGIPLTGSGASRRAKKDIASVINKEQFLHRSASAGTLKVIACAKFEIFVQLTNLLRRTGRTGRMGNGGVNIVMYDPTAGEAGLLSTLERAAGIKFVPLEPPSSKDLIHRASKDAVDKIRFCTKIWF